MAQQVKNLAFPGCLATCKWPMSLQQLGNGKNKKKKKKKKKILGVPVMAQWLTNPTRKQEVVGSIPDLAQWVKDLALL